MTVATASANAGQQPGMRRYKSVYAFTLMLGQRLAIGLITLIAMIYLTFLILALANGQKLSSGHDNGLSEY